MVPMPVAPQLGGRLAELLHLVFIEVQERIDLIRVATRFPGAGFPLGHRLLTFTITVGREQELARERQTHIVYFTGFSRAFNDNLHESS